MQSSRSEANRTLSRPVRVVLVTGAIPTMSGRWLARQLEGEDEGTGVSARGASRHGWSPEGQTTEAGDDGEANVGTASRVSKSVLGVYLLAGRTSL